MVRSVHWSSVCCNVLNVLSVEGFLVGFAWVVCGCVISVPMVCAWVVCLVWLVVQIREGVLRLGGFCLFCGCYGPVCVFWGKRCVVLFVWN